MCLRRPSWHSSRLSELLGFTLAALIHIIYHAMQKSPLVKTVESGIGFLSKVFPLETYLYFPLLNTALFWAIQRAQEWKEKIFSWKVWLDPERIESKPDEFVLSFFKGHSALNRAYESEIQEGNLASLREAFSRLYPILGLEDPFLSALFHEELKSNDFKKIVRDFEIKVRQAEKDIEACQDTPGLLKGLKNFADEMLALNLELISEDKAQSALADLVKKQLLDKDE